MKVSVVIPALNEERRIVGCLTKLRMHAVDEVVVVDGNSRDRTFELAQQQCQNYAGNLRVVRAAAGRGHQMNVGAELAAGDVLLFLHVDVELPIDAVSWIERLLVRRECIAGAFKTHTVVDIELETARWWYRHAHLWLRLADLRSRYARLPYGDQALFVKRSAFLRAGGFPAIPLMEDLEFSRRLARLGRICLAEAEVLVSGRRFLAHPILDTALVNVFPLLYRFGVSPEKLAALYRHIR